MGERIGEPVNGWQLRFVEGKDSVTKTNYATLFNGRLTIDVYGVGPDGFVPREEIVAAAEAVRERLN